MKIMPFIAAAGFAAAAIMPIASVSQAQRAVVVVGAPTGPGWYGYRERTYRTNWDGPRYYTGAGEHHGRYRYNNGYYDNCSYRWTHHHRRREWRCW